MLRTYICNTFFTLFAAAIVIFGTQVSSAQTAGQKISFPEGKFGTLVQEWIRLINDGSEPEMKKFVEENFSADAKRTEPVHETLFLMKKLRQQSGGLEVLSVTPPRRPQLMTLSVKSRRGEIYAQIGVGEDQAEPGKIRGYGVWSIDPPGTNTRIQWPEQKLSEKEVVDEIRRQVAKRAADGKFSGVVLIAKDDDILLHAAHGLAERSFNVPNKPDTKFNLASVGKMFTATAIAQLVRQGKISYDDKLIKHLPDFPNRAAAEKITIHQLLTHTSGLGTLFYSPGYERLRRYRSSWDEISAFADEKLAFEPGARWSYSNAGYVTLGAVIERVTGKNYVDYVRENVFLPLGMKDTDSYAHDEVVPNMSVLYVRSPDDPLGIEPYVADHILGGYRGNAEGGGYSTALDLFKFARAYRKGNLVGEDMLGTMTKPHVDEDGRARAFWGYGVKRSVINGEDVLGHSGGGRTHLQMFWNSGYTVIVMTNTVPPPVTELSNEIVQFMTKQISGGSTK